MIFFYNFLALLSNLQEPDDLNPLTRLGLYFRDQQLKKALAIVVSPGQATGKVDEVLDLIKLVDTNNKCMAPGLVGDCQDNVSKWWSAVLSSSACSMLDQSDKERDYYQLVECGPGWRKPDATLHSLGKVVQSAMASHRQACDPSPAVKLAERAYGCDVTTDKLEDITENLLRRQENLEPDDATASEISIMKVSQPFLV